MGFCKFSTRVEAYIAQIFVLHINFFFDYVQGWPTGPELFKFDEFCRFLGNFNAQWKNKIKMHS